MCVRTTVMSREDRRSRNIWLSVWCSGRGCPVYDLTYIINIKIVSVLFIRGKKYLPIATPIRTASRNSGVFFAITILKII